MRTESHGARRWDGHEMVPALEVGRPPTKQRGPHVADDLRLQRDDVDAGPVPFLLRVVGRDAQARLWPAAVDSPRGWDVTDRHGTALPAVDPSSTAQAKFGAFARYRAPAYDALPIAFELQQAVSRARIGARMRELVAYLRLQVARLPQVQILTPTHPSLGSGIVALRVNGRDHGALEYRECAGDAAVRAEAEALLEASERVGGFLESPAPGVTVPAPDG